MAREEATDKAGAQQIGDQMKPATDKAWAKRRKLQQLAERGIDGERESAIKKLSRLEARFDFSVPQEAPPLFFGDFEPSETAVFLADFTQAEAPIAPFIKWAIEHGTGIQGTWRGSSLWVEASAHCLARLAQIVEVIRRDFDQLWRQFAAHDSDGRNVFLLGLYDGMMADEWQNGKPLPRTSAPKVKRKKPSKRALAIAPAIHLHPYSVAVELGQRIRLSVPLSTIAGELQAKMEALAA